MGQFLDKTGLGTLWSKIKNTFATKTDLDNYSTQANVQARINTALNSFGEYCDETYATKDEIVAAMHYKGTKASYSDLPTTGNTLGDVWNVTDTGKNYAWNDTSWDELSGVTDLSAYLTKTEASNTYVPAQAGAASTTYVTSIENLGDGIIFLAVDNKATGDNISAVSVYNTAVELIYGNKILSNGVNGLTYDDNQILDSSMALTETEINNICK